MDVITSQALDTDYSRVCSQIGDIFSRREELLEQVDRLDAQLGELVRQRAALVKAFQTVAQNEKAAVKDDGQ